MVSYAHVPGVNDSSGSGIGRLGSGLPVREQRLEWDNGFADDDMIVTWFDDDDVVVVVGGGDMKANIGDDEIDKKRKLPTQFTILISAWYLA